MKNFIQLKIHTSSKEMNEILIAELSENNFYAFEEEEFFLMAYIQEQNFNSEELKRILPKNILYEIKKIKDENWNAEWEKNFQPVIVENFAGIRASFHKPLQNVLHEIIITPKMSFGTGHHATTFLMIQMMQEIDFNHKKILDFGTGTGVLSILAEKLGASSVLAIDIDDWSITNASENMEANKCKKILLKKSDTLKGAGFVDIVLANINLNVLQNNVADISALLYTSSFLLISGILTDDEYSLEKTFEQHHLIKKQAMLKDGWLAILFQKT